jgi:5'-nucleotidase
MKDRPFILVSNDDGIASPFLRILAEELIKDFDVAVAAPKYQQSCVGRGFSFGRKVYATFQKKWPCPAWAIDGTPSDCVNIALGHLLGKRPAVIVSGINKGHNASLNAISCSGTVAAAIEGAFWGLPAFAFSMVLPKDEHHLFVKDGPISDGFKQALHHSAVHARKIIHECTDQKHPVMAVHNINFPHTVGANTIVRRTEPTLFELGTLFACVKEGEYEFLPFREATSLKDHEHTDYACIRAGDISHTILDYNVLGGLFHPMPPSPSAPAKKVSPYP